MAREALTAWIARRLGITPEEAARRCATARAIGLAYRHNDTPPSAEGTDHGETMEETTENNTPKPPTLTALLPDTEMRALPCKLTQPEVVTRARDSVKLGHEIEDAEREIDRIKERAKADAKIAEERLEGLAAKRRHVDRIVHDGAEDREVRCTRYYDRKTRICTIVRDDTGEPVQTRPMSDDEIRRGCDWIYDYPAKVKRLTHPEGDVVETEPLSDKELQTHLALPVRVAISRADWTRIEEKKAVHERFIRPEGVDEDIDWTDSEDGLRVVAEIATQHLAPLHRLSSRLEPPVTITELGVVEKTEEARPAHKRNGKKGRAAASA